MKYLLKKLSRKEIKKVTLLSNREIREVKKISNLTKQRISDFCSWCKNRKGEWFSLRDLMGGDNFYWNGTPLLDMYLKQKRKINLNLFGF